MSLSILFEVYRFYSSKLGIIPQNNGSNSIRLRLNQGAHISPSLMGKI